MVSTRSKTKKLMQQANAAQKKSPTTNKDRLNAIENYKVSQLPIKQNNKHLINFKYMPRPERGLDRYSTEEIGLHAALLQARALEGLEDQGINPEDYFMEMQVSTLYDQSIGWQSGKWRYFGANVNFYNFAKNYNFDGVQLQDDFGRFNLMVKMTPKSGGAGKGNHCLFHAICKAFVDKDYLPKKIGTSAAIKLACGVGRNEKIPCDRVHKIEKRYPKLAINVIGDHVVQSKNEEAIFAITVKLENGHYTYVEPKKTATLCLGYFSKVKTVSTACSGTGMIYDGHNLQQMGDGEYESKTHQSTKSYDVVNLVRYIKVPFKDAGELSGGFLKQDHEQYCSDRMYIKAASIKAINQLQWNKAMQIDINKYATEKAAALHVFCRLSKVCKEVWQPIRQAESYWLEKASSGGLIYAEPGEYSEAISYDINKMYSGLLGRKPTWVNKGSGHALYVPTCEGEYKTLKALPAILPCGIYRCEVEGEHKLFHTNPTNHYTHFDLYTAQELKLKITLIEDSQPNALIYGSDKCMMIQASQLFEPFFDLMTVTTNILKQDGSPEALQAVKRMKLIGNCLWGGLSQKNIKYKVIKKDAPLDMDKYEPISIVEIKGKEEHYRTKLQVKHQPFKTSYARLCPFITAIGRRYMYDQVKQHASSIVRIHTDGFISTKRLAMPIGDRIGQWKVEKQGSCKVIHVNKQEWKK